MTNVQELLNASPAPRVTEDMINSAIESTQFTRFTDTVTLCNITLKNGFSVRGESACVNAANYNQTIGEEYAQKDAFKKLWPLFGFWLAQTQYLSNQGTAAQGVAA